MDWEVINGITGLISAICALLGIGYFSTHKKIEKKQESPKILSPYKLASFVIACSGWALCCLCYLWIEEPFGSYPRDDEYRQFFGAILAFPAIVILIYGTDLLINGSESASRNEEPSEKT